MRRRPAGSQAIVALALPELLGVVVPPAPDRAVARQRARVLLPGDDLRERLVPLYRLRGGVREFVRAHAQLSGGVQPPAVRRSRLEAACVGYPGRERLPAAATRDLHGSRARNEGAGAQLALGVGTPAQDRV